MKKKGCDVFADILAEYGTEYIYGIPGATEIWFMDVLEKRPEFKYILGLNEITCVSMAEGYARASGKAAVLNLHTAYGLAAAMPQLLNCRNGKVPLVVTVGENDSRLLSSEPQLSGGILETGAAACKYSAQVANAQELPMMLHRAFKEALTPPRGVVLLSIPGNFLNDEIEYDPKPIGEIYSRQRGDIEGLKKAAELIKAAKNPVICVQDDITTSGALGEMVHFAELCGAGVYQVWMADANFPTQHPLNMGDLDSTGPQAQKLLADADLLIAVGCQLFNDAFYSGLNVVHKDLKIVHICENPHEIGKNFVTDAGIVGDPKTVLAELNGMLEGDEELEKKSAERFEAIKKITDGKKAALAKRIEEEKDRVPIAPSHIVECLRKVMPADALILDDSWSSSGLVRSILDLNNSKALTRPRNGGSIGFGPGGALGLKQGAPDKPVIAIMGDGSTAWGMQGFWSAAHYKIPVTYIIVANGVYRQVKLSRKTVMGDYDLTERHLGMQIDEPRVNFVELAESMGVPAVRVTDPAKLEEVLREAVDSKELRLVEVIADNPAKA